MTNTAVDPLAAQFERITHDDYVANVQNARLHRVHEHWRVPDPAILEKKPQPTAKDATKGKCLPTARGGDAPAWQDHFCGGWHGLPAVHLDYMGHAAVTDALLQEDPTWGWEPLAYDEHGLPMVDRDSQGHARGLWMRLTVHGHSRLGYGTCPPGKGPDAIKELIGDGIRNAALRFGIGTSLWAKIAWDDLPAPTPTAGPAVTSMSGAAADAVVAGDTADDADEQRRLMEEFMEPDTTGEFDGGPENVHQPDEPVPPAAEAPAERPTPPADAAPAAPTPAAPSTGPAPAETIKVVREMITSLDSSGARAYAKYRRDKKLPPKPDDMTLDQALELADFLENLPKA